MDLRDWWERVRGRVTVGLVMAVALLSLVTGIANIGSQTVFGPLAAFVPTSIQRTAGFTGALTGFLMMTSALGLRRGLRVAWTSTVVLLPVTAIQGLVQSSPLSLPLIGLSILAIPNVLAHRRRFDRELSLSPSQMAALAAIAGAQVYGTVGAYALRDEFTSIQTPVDAFYYTLVTASTVGYGDAAPTSQTARLFGMSVVVVGTASFAIALGTLLGPAIEARFSRALGRMTQTQLELLEDHLLLLGSGALTDAILEEIDEDVPIVMVTQDVDRARELTDRGIDVLRGDPADEETLNRVGLAEARAVIVASDDDAVDALAVLTARHLRPDVHVAAAATNRENVEKLRRAGADAVISPAVLGGHLAARSAMGYEAAAKEAAEVVETEDTSEAGEAESDR